MIFLLISILTHFISGIHFPINELTISEFLAYERELGSEIQMETVGMHEYLSPELYPTDDHDLSQPVRGHRPVNEDSTLISFSAYYNSDSGRVKFIEYTVHPYKRDRRKLMREMMSSGNFDQHRFVKMLNEQENNESYQSGLDKIYSNIIQNVTDQNFELKNTESSQAGISNQHFYQQNGTYIKISMVKSDGDWNKHVSMQIYWE